MTHLLITLALAAAPHPIDQERATCLAANPSTAGMVTCEQHAEEQWHGLMAESLEALRAGEGPVTEALLRSQQAWTSYRDAEMDRMTALLDATGGSLHRLNAAGRATTLVRDRALALDLQLRSTP